MREGQQFDFVVSNHLRHHLTPEELTALLDDTRALCRVRALHSDIERSALAYLGFALMAPALLRRSFVVNNGPLSVRRSFTVAELRRAAGAGWQVRRPFPFRLLLSAPGHADG